MRPIKLSKKEWGLAVASAAFGIAGLRPADPYVFVPLITLSWLTCLYLAYHHEGTRSRRIAFYLVITFILGLVAYRQLAPVIQPDQVRLKSIAINTPKSGEALIGRIRLSNEGE